MGEQGPASAAGLSRGDDASGSHRCPTVPLSCTRQHLPAQALGPSHLACILPLTCCSLAVACQSWWSVRCSHSRRNSNAISDNRGPNLCSPTVGGKHPLEEELGCLHNLRNLTNKLGMTQMGKPAISFNCVTPCVIILAWAVFPFS